MQTPNSEFSELIIDEILDDIYLVVLLVKNEDYYEMLDYSIETSKVEVHDAVTVLKKRVSKSNGLVNQFLDNVRKNKRYGKEYKIEVYRKTNLLENLNTIYIK